MKRTQSIRWRLLFWLGLLLTVLLSAFGITAYRLHVAKQFTKLDEQLKRRVVALSAAIHAPGGRPRLQQPGGQRGPGPRSFDGDGPPERLFNNLPPGGLTDAPPNLPPGAFVGRGGPGFGPPPNEELTSPTLTADVEGLFTNEENNVFYYLIWKQRQNAVLTRSPAAPLMLDRPALPANDTGTYTRTRGTMREAFHATERANLVLVGCDVAPEQAAARKFAVLLVVGGLAVLCVGLGGAWWLVDRALQPISDISTAARRIAEGRLSERINPAEADSELGQLAGTLNDTFARLEKSFALQKQFVADAAHELRTPLAVMISESQLALNRERSVADYQESLAANLESAQQMRRLSESLLELARYDAGQEQLRREPLDLATVTEKCARQLRSLAESRKLKVKLDLSPAPCSGDPIRLAQVVTNLLTNAINYNREGGEILLATRTEGATALLTVTDTGIGIPVEDLPHVCERFYRTDKARTRSAGSVGLGLAICQAIIEAHGGALAVTSQEAVGSTFSVRIPFGPV